MKRNEWRGETRQEREERTVKERRREWKITQKKKGEERRGDEKRSIER